MKIIFSEKDLSVIKTISLISGGFTFLVALTMLFSLIQLKTLKPLDNPVLISLKEQFDKDPEKKDIKEQVRAIDLMARKAYFSSRWQVETGSYLLLAGAIIFVICQRILSGSEKKLPEQPDEKQDLFTNRNKRRKYIFASAVFISSGAIIASFVLRDNLPNPLPVVIPNINVNAKTNTITNTNTNTNINTSPAIIKPEQSINTVQNTPPVINSPQSQPAKVILQPATEETKAIPDLSKEILSDKTLVSSSFPNFRGKGGRGIVEGTGFPTSWNGKEGKNIKWKVKIPKSGFNSPVIWGNKVFISGADAKGAEVYCFDKKDGKLLWVADVKDVPGSPTENPEISEDTGLAAPTLATNGSFVCAIFATGNLVCYDMEGNRVWAKALGLPKNHYGHSSSLIIFESNLIVQYDRNDKSALFGFNIANGELIWETKREVKISWASPVIAQFNGRPQILLNADPYVAAYDPITGKEIWRMKTISAEIGPSIAFNDKMIFVANEFAKLIGIKVGDQPEIIWDDNQYLPEVSSPVATNDLLFVATSYSNVACYNSNTGKLLWNHEFDYGFYSSSILNGDNVYLLDISGVMHIFKAAVTYSLVAESPLGEKTVSTPAFSDREIFIRGYENLYCISGNKQ